MGKHYSLKTKLFLIGSFLMLGNFIEAQVKVNQLPNFGTAILDINNQGDGIHNSGYYNFGTNSSTPPESGVLGTSTINDLGNVVGFMDDGNDDIVMGMRNGGVWAPFPPIAGLDSGATIYDISENGIWVVGQTAWSPDSNTAWGFIYNTETQEFRLLDSPDYEYSAAYGVNNEGYAVGWVDDLPIGTLRMPAVFNPDGTITVIDEESGTLNDINNNGIAVGELMANGVIYNIETTDTESLPTPSGTNVLSFTSISDNGVVIGYNGLPNFSRLPVIYHPDLGNNVQFLTDVLADFGIFDTLGGTPLRISSNGNYIAGATDGPVFLATGWAVNFDNKLLEESECTLMCPEDITLTANYGSATATINYEMNYECSTENPNVSLVLVEGLPSGSEFPLGTTWVYYELRDEDENVISSCAFKVIVKDTYCQPNFIGIIDPITYVKFEEIDNETSVDSSIPNEYFLDMVAEVSQGQSYPITVKGLTGEGAVNYVNVFIDWNQDGELDYESEYYNIGALFNSTGLDDQEITASIQVPNDAVPGLTRMRVLKNYMSNPVFPCDEYFYGQTEDYSILVESGEPAPIDECSPETPSNNFESGLGPVETYIFANDFTVNSGESFTLNQVKISAWVEPMATISDADIYLYKDSGNGPGEELFSQKAISPSEIKNIGGNFGYIAYELTFDLNAIELVAEGEENVKYWLGAQIYSPGNTVFWDATSYIETSYEQYIFDPDDLIWVTNTSVFGYPMDGVMKLIGECARLSTNNLHTAEFSYYPNPVTDILNIESQEEIRSVEIFNTAGQKIQNNQKVHTKKINMSNLTEGVYIIRLTLENGQVETFKLIKN